MSYIRVAKGISPLQRSRRRCLVGLDSLGVSTTWDKRASWVWYCKPSSTIPWSKAFSLEAAILQARAPISIVSVVPWMKRSRISALPEKWTAMRRWRFSFDLGTVTRYVLDSPANRFWATQADYSLQPGFGWLSSAGCARVFPVPPSPAARHQLRPRWSRFWPLSMHLSPCFLR